MPAAPGTAPNPSPARSRDGEHGGLELWSIALIATAFALALLMSVVILISLCCYRGSACREKANDDQELEEVRIEQPKGTRSRLLERRDDQESSLEMDFVENNSYNNTFDLDDLLRASAKEIGRGKLGTTYKAMLECGSVVAVKKLEETYTLSRKGFVQHMQLLGNKKHKNLAEIISFCHTREEKLIVYEYVPCGSLFNLLHDPRANCMMRLDWNTRVRIIRDVATSLEYLHRQRIPHGDLKSSNVLIQFTRDDKNDINANFIRAKLTDYGLLPLVPAHKLSMGQTPEFINNNHNNKEATRKADVYCFGILVLEIVTGKVPSSPSPLPLGGPSPLDGYNIKPTNKSRRDLSGWVKWTVSYDWSTDILDADILGENQGYNEMLKLTEIALDCTDELPERRPQMSQVLSRIITC
ncbi:leucine-rich repeat protein kinase family protein [Striga asiatica]|uniref:Leucine-rich repeat protein kinase family protein n=1 Tax=Striga asiatica TaxID=4170 RepID=A0A5A7RHN3_STRAF|nr:leucine-rich repeat protein kinase family protein [Striga asiatica]